MNGRLIDADAFKKILSEHEMVHDKRRSFDNYDCGAANAYEHASDLLDDMPTVKQPHGTGIESKQKKGTGTAPSVFIQIRQREHGENCLIFATHSVQIADYL